MSTASQTDSKRTRARANQRRYSRYARPLLQFFALHRVSCASDVQTALMQHLPSDRVTRLHLQTLVEAGDLAVMRDASVGRPNVYTITTRGLRRATELGVAVAIPAKRRQSTGNHVRHELLITQLAVDIQAAARQRADVQIRWQERHGFHRYTAFGELRPDYAFLLQHTSGHLIHLVEVSSGEESPTRLKEKLEAYANWGESPEAHEFLLKAYRAAGASEPRPTFRLLFVVENRRSGIDSTRLRQVFAASLDVSDNLRQRLRATTVSAVEATNIDGKVWLAGTDLDRHAPAYLALALRQRAAFLTRVFTNAPRYPLFPAVETQS